MKKSILTIITLITCFITLTSFADSETTCPSPLPIPQVAFDHRVNGSDFYSVESLPLVGYFTRLIVKSTSQENAYIRAEQIIATSPWPAWNQAKLLYQDSSTATYYCAYIAPNYHLSTQSPLAQKSNPAEAAYFIFTINK